MGTVSRWACVALGASALVAAGCGNVGTAGEGGSAVATAVATEGAGAATPAGAVVEVKVTEKGYEPARLTAAVGKPLTLRITRTTDKTCAKEIVLKDPPLTRELPLGVPVDVTITPARVGEIAFACSMDMFSGVIDVR
jgi:plastocyanin domain-containing protein